MAAIVLLMPYAGFKLGLMQMSRPDFPELLITLGEKSPMGLLWTFMGFSPVVQFLAGLAEFVAALLLLWRRTAWLGGLIGFIDLAVVWLLNMTFDVPVKIPSALQALLYLLVLAPWLPRLFRFLAGRATEAVEAPQVITSDKVHRVTRFFPAVAAVVVLGAAGFAMFTGIPKALDREGTELSGLYAVSGGDIEAAPALSDDQRWAAIAFGSIDGPAAGSFYRVEGAETPEGSFHGLVALRRASGDLQEGFYTLDGDRVIIQLTAPMTDDGVNAAPRGPVEETMEFTWRAEGDGLELSPIDGTSDAFELTPSKLGTTLLDRPFTWVSQPFNR
ncbi:hypothetical protein CAFEA_03150 [Corynebacterium afermentans subsp. afermentans]|uniref:DoxX family protein n=2 Tax=Corynebacterium afermentans TaxID=38286 RepID=A0A9X8R589_9CORY|nr:hypothetical protein Caferm_01340 [Corynebacterium afermentans subsp. afermentans]WJY56247.1 hypothetical protein CAFEA_03150 [Corynebacterium afermentans subsp. afermentans]SIQ43524.1 hypothetical protein SAMN05421802_11444 [Corynebacterium afermentans]